MIRHRGYFMLVMLIAEFSKSSCQVCPTIRLTRYTPVSFHHRYCCPFTPTQRPYQIGTVYRPEYPRRPLSMRFHCGKLHPPWSVRNMVEV